MIYVRYFKSLFDITGSVILLLCLSPILLVLITLLLFTQGGTIFYRQARSGRRRSTFNLYKFRTLDESKDDTLSMKGRTYTRMGKFMRRSGMDELPQLINILKGEMSFVGPRPMPIEYETRYSAEQLRRFDVKPGLTGWAQVNGRNETSWEKRFQMDTWYVDHVSAFLDLKIMLRTLYMMIKTLFGKGREEVIMDVFKGTRFI